MPRVLIASDPGSMSVVESILNSELDLTLVATIAEALKTVQQEFFDLIIIDVHFDESRMVELMSQCGSIPKNAKTPIVCVCIMSTPVMRGMHDTVASVVKTLGGFCYIEMSRDKDKLTFAGALRSVIAELLSTIKQPKNLNFVRRSTPNKLRHLQLVRY